MGPEALAQVLRPLQSFFNPALHPDLMVGLGSPDDAAVYRLDRDRALILTVDFFSPIVDDPYDFGAIAAANALSDVYAMGGTPILALDLIAFPEDLPPEMLADVSLGMAETVRAAGAVIAGGHSIKDREPKAGLCVAGFAHPDRLFTKGGVRAGDVLIITKPLGTGIITTAAKADQADPDDLTGAVRWMKRLNRSASEVAASLGVHGGTDITGFGLLGHAWEMAEASGVSLCFNFNTVPFLDGARNYAEDGLFPGGTVSNMRAHRDHVAFGPSISEEESLLLFDAQTSGGLLLAVPEEGVDAFQAAMAEREAPFWRIGKALAGRPDLWVERGVGRCA